MQPIIQFQEDQGEAPSALLLFADSWAWPALLLILATVTVAKDWWLRTERSRVWANLALWAVIASAFAILSSSVAEPMMRFLDGSGG